MNVATLLTRAARANSGQTALRLGREALSYTALDREASRFGSALLHHGLHPGDRVAVFMRNRLEYPSTLFGAFRAGLVVVPINAKLHPREVGLIIENTRASALLTDFRELRAAYIARGETPEPGTPTDPAGAADAARTVAQGCRDDRRRLAGQP